MNHHNTIKIYESLYDYIKDFDISHYRYNHNRNNANSFVSTLESSFLPENVYIDFIKGIDKYTIIKNNKYISVWLNGITKSLININCLNDKLYCIYDRVGGEWVCRGQIYKDEESAFEALEGV